MQIKRNLMLGMTLVSLTAAQAHATKQHEEKATDQDHAMTAELAEPMSLKRFMGGTVRLRPTDEKLREAAKDGEMAKAPTAAIHDLVLSTDGHVEWAALSIGGLLGVGDRVVLVPTNKIRTSIVDDEVRCTLGMTKAELENLPEFKSSEVKEAGKLDAAVAVVEAGFRDGKGNTTKDASTAERAPRYVLGSELLDTDLYATDDKFASVSDGVIDPGTHCVDHLIVSRGGMVGVGNTLYLVPTEATRLVRNDDECKLTISKTVAELESGVKYAKPEDRFVSTEDLERADRFFKIDAKARQSKRSERTLSHDMK